MTHALKGRKQTAEHIAKRVASATASGMYARQSARGNPEKSRKAAYAYTKLWKLANQEKVRSHKRKFQALRRSHRAAYQNRRRADQMKATPKWIDLEIVGSLYDLAAAYRKSGIDCHVDHIVPLKCESACGLHVEHNLQLLSPFENYSKKNRFKEA